MDLFPLRRQGLQMMLLFLYRRPPHYPISNIHYYCCSTHRILSMAFIFSCKTVIPACAQMTCPKSTIYQVFSFTEPTDFPTLS